MDKEYYTIPMDSAMKDNSKITFGMALGYWSLTRYKSTEANGSMTNYQDREKSEISLSSTKEKVKIHSHPWVNGSAILAPSEETALKDKELSIYKEAKSS